METNDDRIVLQVLGFLGEMYNINGDFCLNLRNEFAVAGRTMRAPTSEFFCRTYEAGVKINIREEVMLQGEDSLSWEMDISQHNGGWLVDSRICRIGESGTETVLQLPDIVAPNFALVVREAPHVLKQLHEAGTRILRQELKP